MSSPLDLVKINNYSIQVPQVNTVKKKWKGSTCLDVQYWVMAILSKRRSGKSTLVFNLIKNFATKNTITLFFCPTFYKDSTYQAIKKYLDEKDMPYEIYPHFKDEDGDHIESFLEANTRCPPPEQEPPRAAPCATPTMGSVCNFSAPTKEKEKEKKEVEPEYIIVFDDLSIALRHPSVNKLVKNSRHYRAKIILSSQSILDLHPSCFSQLDYVAIFKNMNDDSLLKLYERIEPSIPYETFYDVYHKITSEPYSFLFIDRANEKYRKNLNCLIKGIA